MKEKGNDFMQSKKNKRMESCNPTNCEHTAAWQNAEGYYKVDMVNKPSKESVIDAKEWVDNGSKL